MTFHVRSLLHRRSRLVLAFTMWIVASNTSAQLDTSLVIGLAHTEAIRMGRAFQGGQYDTFIDLTHPEIVRWAGGREAMKAAMSKGLPDGDRLLDSRVDRSKKLFVSGDTVQCAMRERQELLFEGKRYSTLGDVIGISYDAGMTWSFIGVAGRSLFEIRKQFPEIHPGLDVWPQTPPMLIE